MKQFAAISPLPFYDISLAGTFSGRISLQPRVWQVQNARRGPGRQVRLWWEECRKIQTKDSGVGIEAPRQYHSQEETAPSERLACESFPEKDCTLLFSSILDLIAKSEPRPRVNENRV